MKILQVGFKNLNSLVGSWHINFEAAIYEQDGLFAIVGPTGAGKTTILDAICLALYGQTPRLGRLTGSDNALMSRGTGECYAEVIFETASGRYLSRWSQRCAHRRPDGALQPQQHEIAEYTTDSQRILSSKVSETRERIQELTGMDFDQFSKSMLLAQGEFSAFLDATPGDRAPILEQITGTAIYSEISMAVHERRTEVTNRLKTLLATLENTVVLDDEVRKQKEADRARLHGVLNESAQKEAHLRKGLQTVETLESLGTQAQILQKDHDSLTADEKQFEPQLSRLKSGLRASHVEGVWTLLSQDQRELVEDHKQRDNLQQQIVDVTVALKKAKLARDEAQQRQTQVTARQRSLAPDIERARSLDHALETNRRQHVELGGQLSTAQNLRKTLLEALENSQSEHAKKEAHQAGLVRQQETLTAWEGLQTEWSGLSLSLTQLQKLNESAAQTAQTIDGLQKAQTQQQIAHEASERDGSTLQKQCEEAERTHAQASDALRNTQTTHNASQWRQLQLELQARQRLLDKALETLTAVETSTTQLQTLQKEQRDIQQGLQDLSPKLVHAQDACQLAKEKLELAREQQAFAHRVASYEQARAHLKEDEHCPLCGSETHPWAQHIPVQASDPGKTALTDAQQALDQKNDELRELQTLKTRLETSEERLGADVAKAATHVQQLQQALGEQVVQCGLPAESAATRDALQDRLKQTEKELEQTNTQLQTIEQAAQRLEAARAQLDTLRSQWEKFRKAADELERSRLTTQNALEEAHKKQSETELEIRTLRDHVWAKLEVLQAMDLPGADTLTDPAALGQALKERLDEWIKLSQAVREGHEGLRLSLEAVTGARDALDRHDTNLKSLEESIQKLVQQQAELAADRGQLLEGKTVKAVETALGEEVQAASTEAQKTSEAFATLETRLKSLQDSLEGSLARVAKREAAIVNHRNKFETALADNHFADETQFQQSRLEPQVLAALQTEREALSERRTRWQTQNDALQVQRAELEVQARELPSKEDLAMQLQQVQSQISSDRETLGSLREQIQQDDVARQKQGEQRQIIEEQQIECARWDALHMLIGSREGQKYQRFAQGLTFERVIYLANQQLERMSDRYRLVQSREEPLALDVQDFYQGGEVRTTRNLSGGERFLVSLALALGLSRMASHKVRVDSLFLDEGFGTLDDEALETALQALASLRQDGKLVGVISHVPALKERIAAQIHVIPAQGGRSKIEGPGCGPGGLELLAAD